MIAAHTSATVNINTKHFKNDKKKAAKTKENEKENCTQFRVYVILELM